MTSIYDWVCFVGFSDEELKATNKLSKVDVRHASF